MSLTLSRVSIQFIETYLSVLPQKSPCMQPTLITLFLAHPLGPGPPLHVKMTTVLVISTLFG